MRFQTGGGAQGVSLGQGSQGAAPQFGGLPTPPLGNRPFYPGKLPPYRPDQPCHRQKPPDLNGPAAAKSPPTGQAALAAKKQLPELRRKLRPFAGTKDGAR